MLAAAGFEWEEISNWAKPGHECRHNHVYWDRGNYVGFGSAAHSHVDGLRWWNVRTPDRYIAMLHEGALPRGGEEHVAPAAQEFEAQSLALRTRKGVPIEAFASLEEIGHLIHIEGSNVVLSERGRLVANQVILRLRSSEMPEASGSL